MIGFICKSQILNFTGFALFYKRPFKLCVVNIYRQDAVKSVQVPKSDKHIA